MNSPKEKFSFPNFPCIANAMTETIQLNSIHNLFCGIENRYTCHQRLVSIFEHNLVIRLLNFIGLHENQLVFTKLHIIL